MRPHGNTNHHPNVTFAAW
ncbi:hypothetical protein, partial [Klebsiella pneumoniae]